MSSAPKLSRKSIVWEPSLEPEACQKFSRPGMKQCSVQEQTELQHNYTSKKLPNISFELPTDLHWQKT